MKAFADTWGFIAFLNPREPKHDQVRRRLNAYVGKIVTTEWILLELADAYSSPATRGGVIKFIDFIRTDPNYEIIGYDSSYFRAGYQLFCDRPDKAWSLTDCISFVVMQREGIVDALTADHHFEQAGFRAVFK